MARGNPDPLNSIAEATGLYHRQTTEALNKLTTEIRLLIQHSRESFERQEQLALERKASSDRMERGIDKLVGTMDALRHEMEQFRALTQRQIAAQQQDADKFKALIEKQIAADDKKTEAFMTFCSRQLEVMADALQVAKQNSPAA